MDVARWLVVLALVGILAASGCDNRPCLAGHYETTWRPTPIGKAIILQPVQTYVCDKHGPKPSP